MTHTLLIYDMVPEKILFYLIPNEVADTYRHFLKEANGIYQILNPATHYTNMVDEPHTDGLKFLTLATSTSKEGWEEGFNQYLGIFLKYKVDKFIPLYNGSFHINYVYHSGLIL